jgi:hypothetical protein
MIFASQMTLQVGLEAIFGTDPALAATTGIFAKNVTIDPAQGSYDDGQKINADFGADPDDWSGKYMTITFDVPFAGSGAAGTAPGWGVPMKACDWAETATAGVRVEYATQTFNPATSKSAAIYFNYGGFKYAILGARGTTSFVFTANQKPMLRFAMTGLWSKPTDTPIPDVKTAVEAFTRGVEFNKANTTFTFHGITPVLESLQIDQGNSVVFYDRPGGASVDITKRTAAGQVNFNMPTVASLDVMDRAAKNTLGPLALVHGVTAGNIVKIDAPLVQIKQPKPQVVNDKLFCSADLGIIRAATGNGDLKITVQ